MRSPRTHRVSAHRARRERYPQEGMLVQLDGSPHAWLEQRGPRLCLIAAIDDATRRGCEKIFCLGDLGAFGPNPDNIFTLLIDAGVNVMQGNYDNSIGNGLADWEEAPWQQTSGQSANLTDIDGDGLLDIQEFQQGHDPWKKDHPAVGLIVFTPLEK